MNRIEYVGDGKTRFFVFNTQCFDTADVCVCINGRQITDGYTVKTTETSENTDIPYCVSGVEFSVPPISTDVITIYREIQLVRVVDYQPTVKIDTDALNQDFNFTIEVLKDFSDKLNVFETQYAQIATPALIERIDATMDAIDALGNISNKANIDADNFSATGRATLSGLGCCSDRYVNISETGNGTMFVAPANGFLMIRKAATAVGQYLEVKNATSGIDILEYACIPTQSLIIQCPCAKNDQLEIWCTVAGDTKYCRFHYAQGEM